MSGDDLARTRQLTETLQQMVSALAQQAYAGQAQSSGTPPRGETGDTVEGEFREV
jgi:hypothetical protein